MSNLNVQNLNGVNVQNLPSQTARAWVNFDGTTTPLSVRRSFNVASLVDNGTGNYTINFTNALPDSNYVIAGSVGGITNTHANYILGQTGNSVRTNTAAGVVVTNGGATTLFDGPYIQAVFFD